MTSTEDDLLGVAEVAEAFGVRATTVLRWRDKGTLPPPRAELAATTVWERAQIDAHRAGAPFEMVGRPRLLGTAEVSKRLKVDKSRISRWRRQDAEGKGPGFPEPYAVVRAGPIWQEPQIEAFQRSRKTKAKKGGHPRPTQHDPPK